MIHNQAKKLAAICVERNWISKDNNEWCAYALEKWLGAACFLLALLLWSLVSGRIVETFSFALPFYLMRRRIGGCHANKAWICFLVSIALVIISTLFLNNYMSRLPVTMIVLLDVSLIALGLIIKPAYPKQVHFTASEGAANVVKKNKMLLFIFLGQLIALALGGIQIIVCSSLGIAAAIISVLIQKRQIEKEKKHEQT